jgi:hypothetical protein
MIQLLTLCISFVGLYISYKIYKAVVKDGKTAFDLIKEITENPFPWTKRK